MPPNLESDLFSQDINLIMSIYGISLFCCHWISGSWS